MKNTFKALKYTSVLILALCSFIACDKEFAAIDSDVLGEGNFNFSNSKLEIPVLAYNKKLESVQIDGLSSNLLGVFNDELYGTTSASIISQLTPLTSDPIFGENVVIDSVVLNIPYYSKQIGVDGEIPTYELDSLYAKDDSNNVDNAFRLSIYENNYFLRDFSLNPTINDSQKYYSKADGAINATDNFALTETEVINFDDLKGELIFQENEFYPSNEAIRTDSESDGNIVTAYSQPAFRVNLTKSNDIADEDKKDDDAIAYWEDLIINKQGSLELSNSNQFKEYFRGLYFKVEPISGAGSMVLLNLASSDSRIRIHYSRDSSIEGQRTQSSYALAFSGNRLNTFINDHSMVSYPTPDETLGDDKLYLKGGEGSMAILDLFKGDNVECEDDEGNVVSVSPLECFKRSFRKLDKDGEYVKVNGNFVLKRLLNEAHLTIYVDESGSEFNRLYVYDLNNSQPLFDYFTDPSVNAASPINSRIFHLGEFSTDDEGVSSYRLRITEHLNNLLTKDSINTKLGLVISNNVNLSTNASVLNNSGLVENIPSTTVIAPRGTILHGSNENVPEDKRIKLELFFTQSKN